ncbi:MAG: hypothetical protein WCK98_08125 [bacterium]
MTIQKNDSTNDRVNYFAARKFMANSKVQDYFDKVIYGWSDNIESETTREERDNIVKNLGFRRGTLTDGSIGNEVLDQSTVQNGSGLSISDENDVAQFDQLNPEQAKFAKWFFQKLTADRDRYEVLDKKIHHIGDGVFYVGPGVEELTQDEQDEHGLLETQLKLTQGVIGDIIPPFPQYNMDGFRSVYVP